MASKVGQVDVRAENISKAVKGFALRLFKMKTPLLQQSSKAWQETYFRETATELTAAGEGFSVGDVGRGSTPPNIDASWTEVTGRHLKFMAQSKVFYEDKMTDVINVQARTILKVARSIASAVDNYIYSQLTNTTGTSGVTAAAGEWNDTTVGDRDPIGDILIGISAIEENDYDIQSNGYLLLTPLDYSSLMRNSKVINNPSFKTADVVSNGIVGQICGMKIIKSNNVTSGEAMLIIGQQAATWQSVVGITSAVIKNEGVDDMIRSWEIGQIQITDPQGLYTITGTQI